LIHHRINSRLIYGKMKSTDMKMVKNVLQKYLFEDLLFSHLKMMVVLLVVFQLLVTFDTYQVLLKEKRLSKSVKQKFDLHSLNLI
jgi:hypothetical protein